MWVGTAEKVFEVMGSKVKVACWQPWKSRELDGSWTAEGGLTKTYTNTPYSREARWLGFKGHEFRISEVKVTEAFAGGGISIDGSPSKTILFYVIIWTFLKLITC